MPATFSQQFKAVLRKNILLNIRTRGTLREIVNLLIMFAIIVVLRKFGGTAESNIPIYMSIAIMLYCRGVALSWVSEKQTKQAEIQRIMGLSNAGYFAGWFTYFILNGVFLSVLFMGLLASAGVFNDTFTFSTAVGLYILYMLASFSFVLFLSSFFSDAVMASQMITFIQLISTMLYFLLNIERFRNSIAALQITALLPSLCFQYTLMNLGFNRVNPYPNSFTTTAGYITLGCLACGYFILFMYLQLVLPNQNGSHLHPLFFLKCFKKKQPVSELEQTIELGNLTSARYFQQSKEYKQISLYLKNLVKKFDDKTIVNGISLSLFEREIFCLLGHNGAGKTTTINMLTGLLQPDSGTINILGLDYSQMANIRGRMGVCLQTDVLYDNLTVRQHAQYYAKIKGVPENDVETQVDSIIRRCGLQDEQQKRAKELSGGNKRKTCLACAAIGNSEILFLDEPSSGLDPNSRKIIWELIEGLKAEGRTIVLTTHHLEQAEALANRIGILAHGQLLVLGSCHYIKERFGCGYYLQIALNRQLKTAGDTLQKSIQNQRAIIRKTIKTAIAHSIEDEQVGQFAMRFLLPLNQQMHYSALFAFLQTQGFHFSLKLSSLEDIFIRIGMDPTSILTNQPLPELQKVKVPDYQPHYNLNDQFRAVFLKKYRTTTRSFSMFTSIMLPVIFVVVGAVIAMISFNSPSGYAQIVTFKWLTFYMISFFMSLAFSFNTAAYCGNVVRQREIKFKYLACVMGMKRNAYWLGTICFDLLMFCVPFAVLFIVIGCFPSSENYMFISSFGWLAFTLIMFSFSFLSFTYLWSFAFDSAKTAYRFYPFMVFVLFYIVPSIPTYIVPKNNAIKYILPLVSPLMALNNCIMSRQMLGDSTFTAIQQANSLNITAVYIQSQIWYPLLIMLLQTIIYMTLVMVLDNLKFKLRDRQNLQQEQMRLNKSEDLLKEKEKIGRLNQTKPILVDTLYKKYPNGYVAIRDNSFLIDSGETFGLLGPNGAGKSTTFNILTAAIPKTHGSVRLNGEEVNRAVDDIFSTVGVCPQFNPLYDELTTEQHIEFFAGIKGLSGAQRTEVLDFYISNLQLDEYRTVQSRKLSGGNKRKLCVAMALIGNPKLLFLDEPSAGVDPIARRYLWNVLHSSADKGFDRSIVMTTHSINEAESLCDRIGILIKGEFYCIDSPMELKKRYGKGYRATVRCQTKEKLAIVEQAIRANFSGFKQQKFEEQLKLSFEFDKETFIFSKAFDLLYNKLTKEEIVYQFDIAQTTLEEVFIFLSKIQGTSDELPPKATSHFCCWERTSEGCFCMC